MLSLLFFVPYQAFQIPGYLLLIAFVPIEAVVGGAGTGVQFYALFGAYLLALSVVGGVVATVFRRRARASRVAGWRFGVAGGLAVTGGLAVLFAARTLSSGSQLTPFFVVLATGLVLLVLATLLAGVLGVFQPETRE